MPNVLKVVRRGRGISVVLIVCVTAAVIAGCGSSGSGTGASASSSTSSANTLLKQTFQGKHSVKSGKLNVELVLTPKGSSFFKQPITLSFGGPFESGSKGQLPESDFTVKASIQGENLDLSVISAGGHGYISADGNSYELPATDYKKLESGFSSISGSGSGSSSNPFSSLGINPLSWLGDSKVVGTPTIDGTATTQIRSTVKVKTMLEQISKLLGHTSSLGVSGSSALPTKLSASEISKVTTLLGKPSFNVWTGTSDHTIRKLTVTDSIPVSGSISSELDGLKSAGIGLIFTYGDLNQPQTITAPTNLKPYKQFEQKVESLLGSVGSGLIGSSSGGSSSNSSTTSSGSSTDAKYSACLTKAGGNTTKMQKCSSLLK